MTDFPNWTGFTPEFAAAELPRLLDEAEKAVAAIETAEPMSYEDFVWPLDDATRGLWRCWGMVAHELGVMNSEAWRKVEEDWQPKIVAFSLRVSQSKRLYEIAKGLLGSFRVELEPNRANATRRRILDKMVQSAELAGVGLEGAKKERFNEILPSLPLYSDIYYDFHISALKNYMPDAQANWPRAILYAYLDYEETEEELFVDEDEDDNVWDDFLF